MTGGERIKLIKLISRGNIYCIQMDLKDIRRGDGLNIQSAIDTIDTKLFNGTDLHGELVKKYKDTNGKGFLFYQKTGDGKVLVDNETMMLAKGEGTIKVQRLLLDEDYLDSYVTKVQV